MAKRSHPGPVAEGSRPQMDPLRPAQDIEVRIIARELIHPDPDQPRKHADAELREDLRVRGQLDPITVRPHPEILGEWMIRNGERRWRSSEGVLSSLRCQIREDDDSRAARLADQLSHNAGKPLTPLEEAAAYKTIVDETGMSAADVADFVGRPKSSVAERLALLEIGPWLALIEAGELPLSHAVKVILPLRTAADKVHEHAIELLRKDYRFEKQGGGAGISLGDFERLVKQIYLPSMYPLTKTKTTYYKQPEIPAAALAQHDQECDCGGIMFDLGGDSQRRCCGNPGWWRPLHRAALKAKPKSMAQGRQSTSNRKLYLPPGVPTVKSNYGQTPDGVVRLTDAGGNWSPSAGRNDKPFDPADLVIDDKKLVQWNGHDGYPMVGTKDTAAVNKARAAWHARYEKQYLERLEELQLAIKEHASTHEVSGAGVRALAQLVLGEDACATAIDVAQALGFTVSKAVLGANNFARVQMVSSWLAKDLDGERLEALLTGCAVLVGEKLPRPSDIVTRAQERAIEAIRKRTIPWKAKPKEEKPVAAKKPAKKVAGRKSTAPFMEPMFASPALSKVIGAMGQPRTEVTKKLWAYIKRKGLQDKKNRRMINCDDNLRGAFGGRKVVSMFEMTKLVNKNLATTDAAAARIGNIKKVKGVADAELPLEKLSEDTAELPLGDPRQPIGPALDLDDDSEEDGEGWAPTVPIGDSDDEDQDDLWDSPAAEDEDDLEEIEA